MNTSLQIKSWLKLRRWQFRRLATALRWGASRLNTTPAVLGNAMPKSGSHLIFQVLQGLTQIGPFVNPGLPPVNRDEENTKLDEQAILANIQRMRSGDISYGYIHAREPFLSALSRPGRATVFVFRDPRDMIISHVFYATQIHTGHGMHQYYTETLQSMEERINAAIEGVDEPGANLSSVRTKYQNYLGWLEQPGVLCLRFEELILNREQALNQLLDYLENRGFIPTLNRKVAIARLNRSIIPKKSGTFRKAQPGNWREHFTPENINQFKQITGDLLLRLGYETDDRW
jgi:hypothetical protein